MHKGFKYLVLSMGLGLAGCASAPTGQNFLNDAAATCGARDLFEDGRTYQITTSAGTINHAYSCVNTYLDNSPEYVQLAPNPAADRQFVNTMWQIEIARSKNLLTPEQAQAQASAAIAAHNHSQ